MKRKILSCVLAVSFLIYTGCHNSVELTKQELMLSPHQYDITVITRLRQKYSFEQGHYRILPDSLVGDGVQKFFPPVADRPFQGAIAFSDMVLIETKEFSPTKTILLAGGAALIVAGVIALSNTGKKSTPPPSETGTFSCPFIYSFDGSTYHFESETFSGSVFKGLERPAFDVLYHLKPVNGTYRLKLVNARNETEYVNELALIAVEHPIGTSVIPDRSGAMHTISSPVHPSHSRDFCGRNVVSEITGRDHVYWTSTLEGTDWADERTHRDGLLVEFPKPADARSVKLVVSGKNTRLGNFALEKIFQLKGNNKLEWYQQLETDAAERAKFAGWLKREGMLHVQLWQRGGWVERTAFLDVGPGISREQIAVLDIGDITGNVLKIRLACATDLWCIDQVYVDYSSDGPVHSAELKPVKAITGHGDDVSHLLNTSDDNYYVTINNQYADVEFTVLPMPAGCERSYVVKTQGFYYQWLQADGPSQDDLVEEILTTPGAGSRLLMSQWFKEKGRFE